MKNETKPELNPIEKVVLPLKNDAMNRAAEYAKDVVATVRKELAAAGNDLQKCAAYPSSLGLTTFQYRSQVAKYMLFRNLTVRRDNGSRGMHDPEFASMSPNGIAKFVKETRENAAAQYDAYVAKLNKKIGTVIHAELKGNHVWGFSFLTVELPSGEKQIWKTQQIINQSKYEKVFNQFPTRKVKEAK